MKKLLILGWAALCVAQAVTTFGWLWWSSDLGWFLCGLVSIFALYPLIGTVLAVYGAVAFWSFTPSMACGAFVGGILLLGLFTYAWTRLGGEDTGLALAA